MTTDGENRIDLLVDNCDKLNRAVVQLDSKVKILEMANSNLKEMCKIASTRLKLMEYRRIMEEGTFKKRLVKSSPKRLMKQSKSPPKTRKSPKKSPPKTRKTSKKSPKTLTRKQSKVNPR
jgi:hypothetical protein